jgi:hypothetical protein
MFLSIAILINLRNWIYYLIKIKEAGDIIELNKEIRDSRDEEIRDYHKKVKVYVRALDAWTLLIIVLTFIPLLIVLIQSFTTPDLNEDWSVIFTGVFYLCLGLSFAVVSLGIIRELK